MFNFFKKKDKVQVLSAFTTGKSVSIENVDDEVFSTKMMGDGIAIIPNQGRIYAPCTGKVTLVMDNTKHAIGIKLDNEMEILIHVGLDTVNLMGEGFETHVKVNDCIEPGDLLISFDQEFIKDKNMSDITMLVIVRDNNYKIVNYHINEEIHSLNTPLIEYK